MKTFIGGIGCFWDETKYEGIEGIIQWKRASKPLEKFDVKLVENQYPEIYNDCSIEVPEKITPASRVVAIEVEMYREYVL